MAITANEASIKLITDSYTTPESLRALVAQLDATSTGLVDLFFRDANGTARDINYHISDTINPASGEKLVGVFQNSEAARFSTSERLLNAAAKVFGVSIEAGRIQV